jgi:thiamine-phosphate pyrophosphorylase
MKLIVISAAEKVEKEQELINALFEQGLKIFHLRKPGYTMAEMQDFLKIIQPKYLRRIIIHSNYELIEKYNLAGIHLTGKFIESVAEKDIKEICAIARKKNLKVTSSVHHLTELSRLSFNYDYIFLGPVFDSISKEGYISKLSHSEISESLKNKNIKTEVIALGGIDRTNLERTIEMHFDGVAILGAIWKEFSESGNVSRAVEVFNLIKIRCQTADHVY